MCTFLATYLFSLLQMRSVKYLNVPHGELSADVHADVVGKSSSAHAHTCALPFLKNNNYLFYFLLCACQNSRNRIYFYMHINLSKFLGAFMHVLPTETRCVVTR